MALSPERQCTALWCGQCMECLHGHAHEAMGMATYNDYIALVKGEIVGIIGLVRVQRTVVVALGGGRRPVKDQNRCHPACTASLS